MEEDTESVGFELDADYFDYYYFLRTIMIFWLRLGPRGQVSVGSCIVCILSCGRYFILLRAVIGRATAAILQRLIFAPASPRKFLYYITGEKEEEAEKKEK